MLCTSVRNTFVWVSVWRERIQHTSRCWVRVENKAKNKSFAPSEPYSQLGIYLYHLVAYPWRARKWCASATNAKRAKWEDDAFAARWQCRKNRIRHCFQCHFGHQQSAHRYFAGRCRPMRFVARAQRQRFHKMEIVFFLRGPVSTLVAAKTKEPSRRYLHFYGKNYFVFFSFIFHCSLSTNEFIRNDLNGQCHKKKFNEWKWAEKHKQTKMPSENKWKVLISLFFVVAASSSFDRRFFLFSTRSKSQYTGWWIEWLETTSMQLQKRTRTTKFT